MDSSRYHQEGSPQAERDRLKDKICSRYHIPLERFRTTDSKEKERFAQVMKRVAAGWEWETEEI
ncbi:MAG TPA: hypothetical protein PLU75_05385 [Oscillospiraceae bacterium]|nr:hypothetical protein [Oscillospiraceae bacterium]HQQ88603.1 hypothetical protein [Oscillospiraceae bacterium]HRW56845.1 hypothetical protein [Oscillospiraceae bacterium]